MKLEIGKTYRLRKSKSIVGVYRGYRKIKGEIAYLVEITGDCEICQLLAKYPDGTAPLPKSFVEVLEEITAQKELIEKPVNCN